ncbi:THO complex subunit 7 homolog [Daktulosphaira vitifoliae]|uniref:THO complex subunit 7 homolog n=1 Tax=Daktulosphaira vitifoliae TaxID=58002 RepID=UPI0021AA57F2|nr:THO complex subunit 7 homolog [Daktulosphaira vitifoliae]
MNDEEVIWRKLLIDGDGIGDDRRLNILLKSYLKWCNTKYNDPIESLKVMEKMLVHLNLCEHAMKKSQAVSRMNAEEINIYDNMSNEIDHNIENTKYEIQLAKEELRKAKTIRRNRMEYDVLAKLIIQHPPRTETAKRLDDLKDELQALKMTKNELNQKLDKRKKQLHVLMSTLNDLTDILDENGSISEDMSYETFDDEDLDILTRKEDVEEKMSE